MQILHTKKKPLLYITFSVPPLFSDPAGAPNITGLNYGAFWKEGQVKRLTCVSMAGNPLADLKW